MSKTQEYQSVLAQLVNFQDQDWKTLSEHADTIKGWAPDLVQVFYDTLYAVDETAKIFHEGERTKLETTLANWIAEIIGGRKDNAFWDHQWYVALLHIKRGTKNHYMLGMMNRLQQLVLEKSFESFDTATALSVYQAFLRLSGMVGGLIAICYDEVAQSSTKNGLARVGLNDALITRIKDMQIDRMIAEVVE